MPLIYIILPCYNGEKYILEQLMSLYYQNYKNWYLIFINDGSTDNSEKITRDWILHYNLHNKVKIINKKNGGVTSAVQKGLEYVKQHNVKTNSLIAYCDADDIRTRDKLEIQSKYMYEHPDCDLSYHDLTKIDEYGKVKLKSRMNDFYPKRGNFFILTMGNFITSTSMMFKTKLIEYILPMPTGFGIYQDYWTALVFCINGFNIYYIDKTLGLYRTGHQSLIGKTKNINKKIRNISHMNYFYELKNRFPKIDMSYIFNYNKDRYINRYNKKYSLPRIYFITLIKYPRIFRLGTKSQIRRFYHHLRE